MRRWLLFVVLAGVAGLAVSPAATAQQVQPRIVSGSGVEIEAHPHQVRLEVTLSSPVPGGALNGQCGGSIIDSTHVVTAAHCVTNDPVPVLSLGRQPVGTGDVRVRFGSKNTQDQSSAGVIGVQPAQQYLAGDNTYDAALLTLSPGALAGYAGPKVNRVPLATPAELASAVGAGSLAFATGWGLTSEMGQTSQLLQGVDLPLRPDSTCQTQYPRDYSPDRGVCAGGGGAAQNNPDTCQGDSGGPLTVVVGGTRKLVGITSFGEGCGRTNTPGAYTEVSNPEICALLGGGECAAPAPVTPAPASPRDTTRPAARITSLRCKKRTCNFRVRTSDNSGTVRSLSARVYRRVRVCGTRGGRRSCRTVMRNKKLKTKKITGGYSGTTKLNVARYRLDAVASDAAGNRSKATRKRFRVK